MRVVSLLPSATELVVAAAGEEALVGRSHECDWPPGIRDRPALTSAKNPFVDSQQMHDAVCATLASGQGLYALDAARLAELRPDVIVTQSLCAVCSVDLALVEASTAGMDPPPAIISLNPGSLQDVLRDVVTIGEAVGRADQARAAAAGWQRRVDAARAFVASQPPLARPRVAFMEWTQPIFPAGHWSPQLIAMAGGEHPLNPCTGEGAGGPASFAITNEAFVAADPDWVVVCPCGLDLDETKKELGALQGQAWWQGLRAVCEGRVALVDGNAMFNRPGPRLVDALEFLVGLLHGRHDLIPASFPWEMYSPAGVAEPAGAAAG